MVSTKQEDSRISRVGGAVFIAAISFITSISTNSTQVIDDVDGGAIRQRDTWHAVTTTMKRRATMHFHTTMPVPLEELFS